MTDTLDRITPSHSDELGNHERTEAEKHHVIMGWPEPEGVTRCKPAVGMIMANWGADMRCGVIVEVVTADAEQPFVIYEDLLTGKLNHQYLEDILLPAEGSRAAQISTHAADALRREPNPFLSLYREFSDFEDRLLALYKRLSSPNQSIKDVRNTLSDLRFQIDTCITGWENDVKYGELKPESTGHDEDADAQAEE